MLVAILIVSFANSNSRFLFIPQCAVLV